MHILRVVDVHVNCNNHQITRGKCIRKTEHLCTHRAGPDCLRTISVCRSDWASRRGSFCRWICCFAASADRPWIQWNPIWEIMQSAKETGNRASPLLTWLGTRSDCWFAENTGRSVPGRRSPGSRRPFRTFVHRKWSIYTCWRSRRWWRCRSRLCCHRLRDSGPDSCMCRPRRRYWQEPSIDCRNCMDLIGAQRDSHNTERFQSVYLTFLFPYEFERVLEVHEFEGFRKRTTAQR